MKTTLTATLFCALAFTSAHAADKKKPNILVIWGDDIGWQNVVQEFINNAKQ